jgi:TonB family protein
MTTEIESIIPSLPPSCINKELAMKIRSAIMIGLAYVAAVSARALPQSQTPAPSAAAQTYPAKVTQIRRLLEVMGVIKQLQAATGSIVEKANADTSITISPQTRQFLALFQQRVNAKILSTDFIPLYIPIYDKHFTLDEINVLIAFYETSAGKKTLELQPQIAQETMQTLNPVVQKLMDDADAEIRKEHPELVDKKPAEAIAQVGTQPPARRLKKGSEAPTVVSRVPPHYPESARAKHIEGTVRLNTVIGVKGTVIETKYLSGPQELIQAAVDAVKQWKFEPTLLNGEPVEVECVFELNFQLGR